MYAGTADFQTANAQPIQRHRISGTIDGNAFGPDNVLLNSITINNQCSDSQDAQIGAVYIGTLQATFLPNLNITPTTWQGRVIVVNFSLLIDNDPETWETFSLGTYTVAEANRTMQGVEITAYDNMSKFDQKANWDYLPNGQLYSVLLDICSRCGVTLGMTKAQCEALPNGTENIGMYPGSDVQTYRDIIFWLSQIVGGFATCDRLGRLVLRSYTNIMQDPGTVPELPADRRLQGASISDYTTNFRGVTLYNMKREENVYYGGPGIDPVYDLGANPFLQYGTPLTIKAMAERLVTAVGFHLRPFTAEIMSAPIWELGDRIKLTGGIATGYDTVTVIHAFSYISSKGMTLQCYGANPTLAASDTEDKAASSASNSARLAETGYKRYANANDITVATTPQKIVEITFTAEKDTDFDVWHEFLLETQLDPGSTEVELEAVYYLDGSEIARKPIETWEDEAKHILTLNYSESVSSGPHIWQVYLSAAGGTATIDTNDAIAVLKGQGLSNADTWDGVIILTENVQRMAMEILAATVSETSLTIREAVDVVHETFTENITPTVMEMEPASITENITITMWQPTFVFEAEESTDALATETGSNYIETE